MTKLNEIPYAQDLLEKCKEHAYAKIFSFVGDNAEDGFERIRDNKHLKFEEKYKEALLYQLKLSEVTDWNEDFSLPSKEFRQFFDDNRKSENDTIKELFTQGDCLTYQIMSVSDASWDMFYDKHYCVQKLGGRLVSPYSKFPINNHTLLAFFSNGRFFIARSASLSIYQKFRDLMIKKGYPVQEPEEVDFDFLKKIDSYARKLYLNSVVEEPQPEKLEFINYLFQDKNICLTASKLMNTKAERREYLALFEDGRLIVSDRYKDRYENSALSSKVKEFISNCRYSNIVLTPQYVPHHYIDTIYKAAKSYDWYASIEEIAEHYAAKKSLKKDSPKIEEEVCIDIEQLFANENICLTASSLFPSTISERQTLAFFKDGSFFVDYKRDKDVYTQSLISKLNQKGIIFNKPIIVERSVLDNIYKKAAEYSWYIDYIDNYMTKAYESVENNDRFIDNLFKKGAKCLTVTDIDFALKTDKTAFAFFDDGTLIINENCVFDGVVLNCEVIVKKKFPQKVIVKKYMPKSCLDKIYAKAVQTQKGGKDIYIEMLKKQAKQLDKSENILHHQALELVAQYNDFANWKDVCEVDEDFATILVSELKEKAIYLKMFNGQAESLSASEGIPLVVAQEIIAKKQGFANWKALENSSYAKLMTKM